MKATWALGLILCISVIHYSAMGWHGEDPSDAAQTIMYYSLYFMFAWWAIDDAKLKGVHRPIDFGAFIFFAWPVTLPAYLIKTRGFKGIFVFLFFISLYFLPWLTGLGMYYANPTN